MLAAIDGQILFLIVAAIIGVINWLSERKKEKPGSANPQPQTPTRADTGKRESEEERLRRFLEALGVPQGSAPPPPVERRSQPPPMPPPPIPRRPQASPQASAERLERRRREAAERAARAEARRKEELRQIEEAKQRAAEAAESSVVLVQEVGSEAAQAAVAAEASVFQTVSSTVSATGTQVQAAAGQSPDAYLIKQRIALPRVTRDGIRTLLRDRESVRTAVILHEVLGPPRGL